VSRREIQRGTKIGSLNTIDEAVAALEAYGFILRFPEPGSNDGHQYELLTLDERPIPVVNVETITKTLRQLADNLEGSALSLSSDQLNQWAILASKARRLISGLENSVNRSP
jgi:hypothetical protein